MRRHKIGPMLALLGLLLLASPLFASAQTCTKLNASCSNDCDLTYGPGSNFSQSYASDIGACPGTSSEYSAFVSCYTAVSGRSIPCYEGCGSDAACIEGCSQTRMQEEKICINEYAGACRSSCKVACLLNVSCPASNSTSGNGSVFGNLTIPRNNSGTGGIGTINGSGGGDNGTLVPPPPNESTTARRSPNCTVSVSKDYDGVSADGVSTITFTMETDGAESFSLDIVEIDGPLKGTITRPAPNVITFTPDSADETRNYLHPQRARVVGRCTAGGKTNLAMQDFTVEQPPLFFVHGLKSDAQASFGVFEKRAASEGWQYNDINYGGEQDNAISAQQLSGNLKYFIQQIRAGKYYGGRRISATKVDIVSHSMGGLVTRYYISHLYEGNIRKFVMMGTPNHGAWDAYLKHIPIFGAIFLGGEAVEQLKPNSAFLADLNSIRNNPDIEYHSVAGTEWVTDFGFMQMSRNGDGIVMVNSVRLPGVPLYCTYDAHAGAVYWIGVMTPTAFPRNGGGWTSSVGGTLTTSDAAYGIVRSAILTGKAESVAPCPAGEQLGPPPPQEAESASTNSPPIKNTAGPLPHEPRMVRGTVYSPIVLHAYDSEGRHIGPNAEGVLENQIGQGAYYSNLSETGHSAISIYGNRSVYFKMVGTGNGTFDFEMERWNGNETAQTAWFRNVSTMAGQVNQVDALAPEPRMEKTGLSQSPCPLALLGLVMLAAGLWCRR